MTFLKVQEDTIWLFWFTPLFCLSGEELRVFPEKLATQRRSVSSGRLLKCPSLHLHLLWYTERCIPSCLQNFPCWRNYTPVIPLLFKILDVVVDALCLTCPVPVDKSGSQKNPKKQKWFPLVFRLFLWEKHVLRTSDLWLECIGTITYICYVTCFTLSMHTRIQVGYTSLPCFLLSLRYFCII